MPYSKGGNPPADPSSLRQWVSREFEKVEEAFLVSFPNPMPVTYVEPTKIPQDAITFAFADGTDWNPGSGRGLYYYDPDAAAWVFVA